MIQELLQELFDNGYTVLLNGEPLKIEGDINEYLKSIDQNEPSVYVISDLLKLSRKELENLILI